MANAVINIASGNPQNPPPLEKVVNAEPLEGNSPPQEGTPPALMPPGSDRRTRRKTRELMSSQKTEEPRSGMM